jgi:hypothetical protein
VQQSVPITVNGVQISSGDYIGVFYPNLSGGVSCGGYVEYTGAPTNISAWPEDMGGDGFPPGQEFIWKIWDASSNTEYLAVATYDQTGSFANTGQFAQNGFSSLTSLVASISPVPWSYNITSSNHTVLIPESITVLGKEELFDVGDCIGAFYYDSLNLVCGGYCTWYGTTTNVTVWGDDAQTTNKDGFFPGEEFIWKVWDASDDMQHIANATYLPNMMNLNLFQVNGLSGLDSLIVDIPWSYNITSTNHSILIPSTGNYTINNIPLEFGDYMGVFYDSSGTLKCGGFTYWEGATTGITAWGEDMGGDGFSVGDTFIWKIYDISEGIEYLATPTYMPPPMVNQGTFTVNGLSGIESLYAQSNEVPWTFLPTPFSHTIMVPDSACITIDTSNIEIGDHIGVFYDSLGTMRCAGYTEWTGDSTNLMAYGAQSGLDGFDTCEVFNFRIWDASEDTVYDAFATYDNYMPNQEEFANNGMSCIVTMGTSPSSYTHEIPMFSGWGIYSTYLNPFEPNIDSIFVNIASNIQIVKDGLGAIYWPQYGLNMIGNLNVFNGYQIKTNMADTLIITGDLVNPEQNPMSLPAGWGIYSYLRTTPAPITQLLSPIVSSIEIVKDGQGAIYWPAYGLDMIGNMIPGYGYQMKLTFAQILTYPANTGTP